MKTNTFKLCLSILTVVTLFISCEEDDDPTVTFVEEDRTVQQAKDNDSIIDYLSTHYFNSSFFDTGVNHNYSDIIITELGSIEDGNVFDSRSTPIDLSLVGNGFTSFGTIRAWQLVMPTFNSAFDFTLENGVVNYNNYGLGVMFVPSGLAYFAGITTGSSYDNLIFKFELLQYEEEDHDGDGIPSYLEDLDGNGDISNDDTDENEFPNFIDLDDDGDEVLTFDELEQTIYIVDTNMGENEPTLEVNEYEFSRSSDSGVITITTIKALDTDSNGILDYLDEGVSINYNDTSS